MAGSSNEISIRGSTLKQRFLHEKAEKEYEDLLSSQEKGAPYKAFAKGMAVGAAIPTALNTVGYMAGPWKNDILREQSHHVISARLRQHGYQEAEIPELAAGITKFLNLSELGTSEKTFNALDKLVGEPVPKSVRRGVNATFLEPELSAELRNGLRVLRGFLQRP